MQRQNFRFFHRLRVRWAEVDMQKIVFNAHYLMYFDTAIADYWRALALPYEAAMAHLDGDLYMRKSTVDYNASARMDDVIDIGMKCTHVGTSSILFEGGLFRGDELLVSSELVYVFADPATQTSRPVPNALRAIFTNYEAGGSVCEILTGDWAALGAGAGPLRQTVFVEEQRVPADMEWDAHDLSAVHAVARNGLGQTIATGRLVSGDEPGQARIGRMAVHRALRGGGHGEAVLRALEAAATARGDTAVMLHAQRSAESFYARLGYVVAGEPFVKAGIGHIEMRRKL